MLRAISPYYAIQFFAHEHWVAFFALGTVVLCITGAEALYADMGHFGKKPIRISWFGLVLPALVLNYFGQGALLIANPAAAENPFYLLVPPALLIPMIVLATAATVIASQAVISGAFSVTREAIQLGYLPRMEVRHTSRETRGQIYLPWINRMLLVLTLAVVVGFRSSDNLGAAYGIAVVGTMTIDSILVMIVFRRMWHWTKPHVAVVGGMFLFVDAAFLTANADKVEHGGWFPLVLGSVIFTMMATWRRGRELVMREIRQSGLALEPFISSIATHPPLRVPGTAVFLTANLDAVPHALLHNLKHNKVLHERNVLLTVEVLETPTAEPDERVAVASLGNDFYKLDAPLRFRRGSRRARRDRIDPGLWPPVRPDGYDVLPQPREHRRDRPARHGALARQAVRLHAAQRDAGDGVLPDSGQSAGGARDAGRDLRAAGRQDVRRQIDAARRLLPTPTCAVHSPYRIGVA